MNLNGIGIKGSMIRSNGMKVQAFDLTKTYACGEIDLNILAGTCEVEVYFAVVDISTVFNLLLGNHGFILQGPFRRAYIRKSGFLGNKLVPIMAEEDIPVLVSTMVPFIDLQQVDPTSKFVSDNYISENKAFLESKYRHPILQPIAILTDSGANSRFLRNSGVNS